MATVQTKPVDPLATVKSEQCFSDQNITKLLNTGGSNDNTLELTQTMDKMPSKPVKGVLDDKNRDLLVDGVDLHIATSATRRLSRENVTDFKDTPC